MENLVTKVQKLVVAALAVLLLVVVVLSTAHLGVLVVEEIWKPPRLLIPVQGLLDIFGFFLLVLIGVELLDTVKAYFKKDVIHVRVVLEVALIAMALCTRLVWRLQPDKTSGVTCENIGDGSLPLFKKASGYSLVNVRGCPRTLGAHNVAG